MSKVSYAAYLSANTTNANNGARQPMSPLQAAADPTKQRLLSRLVRVLATHGYDLNLSDPKPVRLIEIDRALKASDRQPDTWQIKNDLFMAGLIEA